jgi:nucleoside-diphosphate-sugar epimerase
VPKGGVINHVYVDNLVDGIFLALERRAHGEVFNVTDGVATPFEHFFSLLASRAALKPPRTAPAALVRGAASLISALRRRGLTDNEASADTVRYLMRRHAYSIDKARRMLGYSPRVDLDAGLGLTQAYIDEVVRVLRS